MNRRSLRWRLLLGAAAAVLVALVIAWVFMTVLFERHLERRLAADLTRDGLRLAAAVALDPAGRPTVAADPLADPRFQTPGGGLYWQASTPVGSAGSRSLWDQTLDRTEAAPADDWRLRRAPGPYGDPAFILERTVRPDATGPAVLIQLAQDAGDVADARQEFGRELALFLAILWLVLSAAAWAQVTLGLRPLAAIRRDLDALRDSPSARLAPARLEEIAPLTDAINALAGTRERDLDQARGRAADLAHGLKTPLAALDAQSRRAREAGADRAADGLERAIAAIRAAAEAELARARIAGVRSRGATTLALPVIERLVRVLEHTDRGGAVAFDIELADDLTLPLDAADLTDLVGPILENAVRFARRRLRVTGAPTGLTIEDDGPGLTPHEAERALARGVRLDQRDPGKDGGGAGLGLAIARELAEATGGRLTLSASDMGGLRVDVTWPTG